VSQLDELVWNGEGEQTEVELSALAHVAVEMSELK
jgi:hypothetical protein